MQVGTERGMSFVGVQIIPDKRMLRFNKKEMATLRRAQAIIEEARDRLAVVLDDNWDDSPWYTLNVELALEVEGRVEVDDYWYGPR